MKGKHILGIVALAMVALLGAGFVAAFPFGNAFLSKNLSDQNKTDIQEQRQAVQTAIENDDYASWKDLMEQRIAKMQASITEENFNKIVDMSKKMAQLKEATKEAKASGDYSKVDALKTSLGISGKGFGMGKFRPEPMEAQAP